MSNTKASLRDRVTRFLVFAAVLLNECFNFFYWLYFEFLWDLIVLPLANFLGLSSFFIKKVRLDTGIATGKRGYGYIKFQSIRYATAARFQAPKKLSYTSTRDLNAPTASFPQPFGMGSFEQTSSALISYFLARSEKKQQGGFCGSEDYGHQLNIWTPSSSSSGNSSKNLRKVIVIFHGGAFAYSSCHQKFLDGTSWAKNKNYVVVSANYRLGSFGFLHHRNMDRSQITPNCGTHDQIFVLRWVKENIQKFGGDPNQVTCCGESAGSMSTSFLLSIDEVIKEDLIQKAFMMSGSNLHLMNSQQSEYVYFDMARRLGFVGKKSKEEESLEKQQAELNSNLRQGEKPKRQIIVEISEEEKKNFDHVKFAAHLRSLPTAQLEKVQTMVGTDVALAYRATQYNILMPFHPTLDNRLFFESPLVQMKKLQKKYNKPPVPCFLGSCGTEYTLFTNMIGSGSYAEKHHPINDDLLLNRLQQWTRCTAGTENEVSEKTLQNVISAYQNGNCRLRMGPVHPLWNAVNGDFIFRCPLETFASRMGGSKNFVYCVSSESSLPGLCSPHCADMPYFFDVLRDGQVVSGFWTPARVALKNKMMTDLDNFMQGNYQKLWTPWSEEQRPVYFYDTRERNNKEPSSEKEKASFHYSGLVFGPDDKEIKTWKPITDALIASVQ